MASAVTGVETTESRVPIDVAKWPRDEEFAIFPVGSKPKRALFCPTDQPSPKLIGGHRYLFKISTGWRLHQHWSEVIAFELAREIGLPCAPCFLAIDSNTGEVGALSEFFYGYADERPSMRLISGADFLRRVIRDFDDDTDKCHTWQNVQLISRVLRQPYRMTWWGQLLTFDALIGNTDRHSENWGLLAAKSDDRWRLQMAPAFDHGTSLAYQVADKDLAKASKPDAIEKFVARGCHHMALVSGTRGHVALCTELARRNRDFRSAVAGVATINEGAVMAVLNSCCGVELPLGECIPERAEYLFQLISARKKALLSGLGK